MARKQKPVETSTSTRIEKLTHLLTILGLTYYAIGVFAVYPALLSPGATWAPLTTAFAILTGTVFIVMSFALHQALEAAQQNKENSPLAGASNKAEAGAEAK